MSFDRCIQLWNCHYSQDPEQLQSVQKHPPYSLILVPPYSLIPFPLSQPLAPSEWFSGPIVLLLQDGHITGNIPVPSIYLSGHAAGLGIWVPQPGMKRGPLQCRHGVLAAGPPEESLYIYSLFHAEIMEALSRIFNRWKKIVQALESDCVALNSDPTYS